MGEKELPFESKMEQIVRDQMMSKRSVKEIIDEIYSSEKYRFFFLKIRETPALRRLFFLHRFDLFGVDDEIHPPCFYLTNLPKGKSVDEVTESRAFQYISRKKQMLFAMMNPFFFH